MRHDCKTFFSECFIKNFVGENKVDAGTEIKFKN